MRRKGLSFYRRRKRIQASAIQEIFFWAGECVLAFAIGCILVFLFYDKADLCRTGNGTGH